MSQALPGVTSVSLDRRVPFGAIFALTTISIARQLRAKRISAILFLFALPILIAGLTRYYVANPNPSDLENGLIFGLFPSAILPLVALLYSSGMIQDEIEDQTLTYLMIRPIPRWGVYTSKLLATLFVTVLLSTIFTVGTYMVINVGRSDFWSEGIILRSLKTSALFALTLWAYDSIFGAMSLFFKRTLVLGVAYIILFEGVLASIDFMVRKATVMYYFRVLAMQVLEIQGRDWTIDIADAPSSLQCILTMILAGLVISALASAYFTLNEFRVKTPEGN